MAVKLTRIIAGKADMGIFKILRVIDHYKAIVAIAVAIRADNGANIARILIRLGGRSTKEQKNEKC